MTISGGCPKGGPDIPLTGVNQTLYRVPIEVSDPKDAEVRDTRHPVGLLNSGTEESASDFSPDFTVGLSDNFMSTYYFRLLRLFYCSYNE